MKNDRRLEPSFVAACLVLLMCGGSAHSQSLLPWGSMSGGSSKGTSDGNRLRSVTGLVTGLKASDGSNFVTGGYLGGVSAGTPSSIASVGIGLLDKWNLVSVPVHPVDDSAESLFPTAVSSAFGFENAYVEKPTLAVGAGYWLKFSGVQVVSLMGNSVSSASTPVNNGWNIIGSVSQPVAVTEITSVPPGLVTSQFFGYANGYTVSDTIIPGRGYWVKVSDDGNLTIGSSLQAPGAGTVHIVATRELPPQPPSIPEESSAGTIPTSVRLDQNYPNPFNPATTISFSLPTNGHVTIIVYDLLGREVSVLIDEIKAPGEYNVVWNAADLPSGVYYYRLKLGHAVETRRLMLLR